MKIFEYTCLTLAGLCLFGLLYKSGLDHQNQRIQMDRIETWMKTNQELSTAQFIGLDSTLTNLTNSLQTLLKFDQPKINDIADIAVCTITAYTNSVEECDNTPNITADGSLVKEGYIALSRDLIHKWGGKDVYGRKVFLPGYGEFEVRDTMNDRYSLYADIFMYSKDEAKIFGKVPGIPVILLKELTQ